MFLTTVFAKQNSELLHALFKRQTNQYLLIQKLINHLLQITICTHKTIYVLGFSIVIVYCFKILFENILVRLELTLNNIYSLEIVE